MPQEAQQGWVPTEDASVRQFWVLVNCDDITESNMPSEGVTTFEDFRLKTMALIHSSWNAYIFVRCGEAGTFGFMRFYFAKSATSLQLAGRSHTSDEPLPPSQFVESAVIATKTKIVPLGTAADTGADVLSSQVTPINGVISRMNTNAVLSYDGTPLYSWAFDEDTGKGYEVKEEAVPAGTVGSTEVAADGQFASVVPVNPFWSIKTTKKVTTLNSTPQTWTKTVRSPVLFPAVLLSLEPVAILDSGTLYWHKRYTHSLKAAYAGSVHVNYSRWWQKAEPTPISPIEMLTTKIAIRREWNEAISIEDCLHGAILVKEAAYAGLLPFTGSPDATNLKQINYSQAATPLLDWPDEVVLLDADPWRGGFMCEKRVIPKPTSIVEGVIVTLTPWEDEFYIFTHYQFP